MKIALFENHEHEVFFHFLPTIYNDLKIEMVNLETWQDSDAEAFFVSQEAIYPILSDLTTVSSDVRSTGTLDVIIRDKGVFWAKAEWVETLRGAIIKHCPDLNIKATGFVAGMGPYGLMSVSALARMGFSDIVWLVENPESAQLEARGVQKNFFGLNIRCIESIDLLLQPSAGSILINSLNGKLYEQEMTDIGYYNYLLHKSLVVDLLLEPADKVIIEEAQQVNIATLEATEMLPAYWGRVFPQMAMSAAQIVDWQNVAKTRPSPSKK